MNAKQGLQARARSLRAKNSFGTARRRLGAGRAIVPGGSVEAFLEERERDKAGRLLSHPGQRSGAGLRGELTRVTSVFSSRIQKLNAQWRNDLERMRARVEELEQQLYRKEDVARSGASSGLRISTGQGLEGAQARGEALLAQWAREGVLISSAKLAQAWGLTPQALQQATARGELPSVMVARKRLYPAVLEHLVRADVAKVSRALQGLSHSEQLIFWLRPHGGLAGLTVSAALENRELDRVCELASDWASERTGVDADAAA
jgi:hypothetical protein